LGALLAPKDASNIVDNSKFKEAVLEIIKVVTKQQLQEIFKPVLGEVISLLQNEVKITKWKFKKKLLHKRVICCCDNWHWPDVV